MKTLTALCLALVVCFSLSATAFASGELPDVEPIPMTGDDMLAPPPSNETAGVDGGLLDSLDGLGTLLRIVLVVSP